MRIDDLILEADDTLFEAKDFDIRTIKDLNIEHETRMALKTIKGQAAERVAMYIRVGEYLAQEREKTGTVGGGGAARNTPYMQAKEKLGLDRREAIRYTRVATDKRIQKLTVDQIKKIKNYSFTTLLKMASMNDTEFNNYIETGESSDRLETTKMKVTQKMFTGDPQTVMKKMEKYITDNNFEKVELQIRVKN